MFHKGFFVAKEGSSDLKNVRKRRFFKKTLTEWFFVESKMVLHMASLWRTFQAPLFLRVYIYIYIYIYITQMLNIMPVHVV